MKNTFKSLGLVAVAGATLYGNVAIADTDDGDVDSSSTGTVDVSLTTVDTVQVKGLTAIDMSSTYSASDTDGVYGSDEFCVHRNGGDSYRMTLTWAAMAGATTGNADTIPLSIKVDGDNDASDGDDATTGSQVAVDYTGSATRGASDCDNASIYTSATDTNVRAVSTDTYSTEVTVRIDPV